VRLVEPEVPLGVLILEGGVWKIARGTMVLL